jgi:hypothetical protein
MARDDEKDCVVFRHPRVDPDAGWNPNYRKPEPQAVFTGTQAECDAYVKRRIEEHDYANPGMFDAPRPLLEVRRSHPSYRDTDPL